MTATRDARAGLGAGLGERLAALVPMAAVPGDVLASATMLAP